MDPHGHSKPTRRIRALGFSLPIMMHLVGVECNVSLLTNLQQYLHLPLKATTSAVAERNRLFNFGFRRSSAKRSKSASSVPKTKKKRLSTWSHDFVCLWSTSTTKPPSCLEIADLIRAGLGRKQITLFDGDGSHELHREILHTFPRLSEGGGYELLRVAESGQRNLCVIPSPSDGYSVSCLREVLRQAKVYIRPVQNDLSLDPCDDAADSVRCVCSV